MEDKELRERLDRIDKKLGLEPYLGSNEQKETSIRTITVDKIGELLISIEEKKKEARDEAFLDYLAKMEESLYREQMKLEDYAKNIHHNFAIYDKRNSGQVEMSMQDAPVTPRAEVIPQEEPVAPITEAIPQEEAVAPLTEGIEQEVPVAPILEVTPQHVKEIQPQKIEKSAQKRKTDMEFGVGAVVLSVVGALFIIAALVTFGLNFMDNLAQGIFFYVLAGVVIAFSEFALRKHLERFAQAVTGMGVCVLYTATILNYLYLHTINSIVAILITVVISIFALLLSRKRESDSLRMIGILGCYISLMPLDRFDSQMEFIIPCVILVIINIIYLLLPLQRNDKVVRNVHAAANMVASTYLLIMAWVSDLSAAWIFAFVTVMVVVQYAIYFGTELVGSLKGFYITGQILLHLLLAFAVMEETFYIVAPLALALVHGVAYWFYRDMKCKWMGLYGWTGVVLLSCASQELSVFLVGTAIVFVIYKILAWKLGELQVADMLVSIFSALVLIMNLDRESGGNMQYVLLAAFVISIVFLEYRKVFHESLIMTVLWMFAMFGFESLAVSILLALTLLLMCLVLFTKIGAYRSEKNNILIVFAWIYNAIGLLVCFMGLYEKTAVVLTILLLVESILLMVLFSEGSGTKTENIMRGRTFALAIFYSLMVFAFDIELPIIESIILMIIAVASVGVGFLLKIKGVRIYGLCLSLFVCAKLLLVDFANAQSADRVISFLVVGIIALGISYLYMRIERSLAEKEKL